MIALALSALLAGLAWRLSVGWDRPIWLDEAFTGAIAIQPTFSGLIRDCLDELGGPVYYAILWLWARAAGTSDLALRLPSLIFSLAAPAIILARGHSDLKVRLIWSALLAASVPVLHYFNDARSYSLLVLLGCAQVILFRRLMNASSLGRACAWSGTSVLMILTHYYTLPLAAAQAAIYIAVRRRAALRTWPAALLAIPALIWTSFHLPLLLRFSEVAWQEQLSAGDILEFPAALFGIGAASLILCAGMAAAISYDLFRTLFARRAPLYSSTDVAVFASALLAAGAIFILALYSRSFHERYLIPFIPATLFGVAVWARRWHPYPVPHAVLAAFLLALAVSYGNRVQAREEDPRWQLAWAAAARDFDRNDVGRMAFFWDHPTASFVDPELMERVGGFFYARRAGPPVQVRPIIMGGLLPQREPNIALHEALTSPPVHPGRRAFIWIYWRSAANRGDRAIFRPDAWRNFSCRNYSQAEAFVVLACISAR